MKPFRHWLRNPLLVSVLICPLVLVIVLSVWRVGWFQTPEWKIYDFIVARPPADFVEAERVAIVGINEEDIRKYGWALDDQKLAQFLETLAEYQPAVIGLDLYRDLPEPRSGQFTNALNATLARQTNLICIYSGRTGNPVGPPPMLDDQPARIGFNDFPADRDSSVVRRALLLAFADEQPLRSIAGQVAFHFLRQRGVEPRWTAANSNQLAIGKLALTALTPNDGAYVNDDNVVGFQMLLDYRGARTVPILSLDDVLSKRAAKAALAGKMVFVGIAAASVNDFVNTPLQANQYGVLLHAQTADQLVRGALDGQLPARFWPEWLEGGWLVAWCLLGMSVGHWVRNPWRFAAALALVLLGFAAFYWFTLRAGWWLPCVPAMSAFVVTAVLVTSHMAYQEKAMRAVLMKLYSRNVSKDIAEATWEQRDSFLEGGRPRAQALTVTVLFTDLKGFSTVSEQLTPARLYAWLNRYLGTMAQFVSDHGGVLKQFTGDGLLAIFGVPAPHTTEAEQARDADNAVRCALAMGRRLVELNQGWQAEGLPAVSMRVGIYTGEVAAGSIGSDERFEYAVIGDVVNTAARLEQYDKSLADPELSPIRCRILIGAPTRELLGKKYALNEIGLLSVKGKVNKVSVFQVLHETNPAPTRDEKS